MSTLRSAHVRVPGSTSNLGPGFDTLGLALARYLEARFTPGPDPLEVIRTGSLENLEEESGDDLLVRAFSTRIRAGDLEPSGVLTLTSDIPIGRGLGSSSAAVVAGWSLAAAALEQPPDPQGAFLHAMKVDGHGDNAAPSAMGGFRAVVGTTDGPHVLELELSSDIGFAFAAPAAGISTATAREALPRTVDYPAAIGGLGRLTALLRGMASADPELIRLGIHDELHVPHRLPLIPGAYNALGAAYDAGAWGVTISGAGSGLIAMSAQADAESIAAAMCEIFQAGGDDSECLGFVVEPDLVGTVRMPK